MNWGDCSLSWSAFEPAGLQLASFFLAIRCFCMSDYFTDDSLSLSVQLAFSLLLASRMRLGSGDSKFFGPNLYCLSLLPFLRGTFFCWMVSYYAR